MVYVNLLNDNCIIKPISTNRYQSDPAINYPKSVYVVQTPNNAERYVALRIPLINGEGKWALLPFTLFLDIVTSPIQLGFTILTHKSDDNNTEKRHERKSNIEPHPKVVYHH